MEASIGKPSFVWRSICNSKELLHQGLIWRVGDGNLIRVWGDRWLATPISHKVQSVPRIIDRNSKVAYLINLDSKCWKIDLIKEVFSEDEAQVISNIPLSPLLPQDRLIWRGTTNGVFTVRSAYHLGKEVWKFIWSMNVPSPVKLFMWLACHNVLPTRSNLYRRKVVENFICPCCERFEETTLHALWACPAAQDVWDAKSSSFQKCSWEETCFFSLVEFCISSFSHEKVELMAMIARKIWLRRNAHVFEGVFTHPNDVYAAGVEVLKEYKWCNIKEQQLHNEVDIEPPREIIVWKPPLNGLIKVNWDASINQKGGCIGLGIIAWDCLRFFWGLEVLLNHCG
jgi:hypothetical protein